MKTKNFAAKVKAVGEDGGLETGQFEAIVSTFNDIDSYGDVVMPGAFKNDLERWAESGDPIPVIWSHDWTDPFSHLGTVLAAEEREDGLWIKAQIHDLDTNPKAAQVYNLLKGRRVKQFSFAYDEIKSGPATHGGRDVYALDELKIHEVGPCLLGVNQETELLAVKTRQLVELKEAGQTLDPRALTEARDTLNVLLEGLKSESSEADDPESTDPGETDEPSQADDPATEDEEPEGAKSTEPDPVASRRALAVATITTL